MNLDILEQFWIYNRVGHTSCSGLHSETPPRMPWRLVDEDFGNDDYSMNVFTYDYALFDGFVTMSTTSLHRSILLCRSEASEVILKMLKALKQL